MTRVYSHRRSNFGVQKKAKPMEAIYAAAVSIFTVVAYIVLLIIDIFMAGETPRIIGGLCVLFFITAIVTFIYNIGQMRTQTEVRERVLCMVISSIALLVWVGTFAIGMFN